ncbi:MAG TPA: leucine--tRNA ligase [Candidatus Pacearchaeota archaeon]|nr:leucine--tRNA ligase [Candidatus Pacearchaeota archaeon]
MSYPFREIEKKWQERWEKEEAYLTKEDCSSPKFYVLDMFPYPSGQGLHVGHLKGYVATDIIARWKRTEGFNVLHPMGWDAFGLPAENYAIKTGIHPETTTKNNIANIKRQMKMCGFSYDWSREINTTDPNYYKWTQWIFLQLFKKGLAYKKLLPINWCPSCKTGLANEEVVNGKCERCGAETTKKDIEQWVLKITDYAEQLLADLEELDWPDKIKEMQKAWIGRSEGWELVFKIKDSSFDVPVFTTRADTLFGCTYLVLAPEHSLFKELKAKIENWEEVSSYIEKTKNKSERERISEVKEKTGVEIKGIKAVNPINGKEIPVFIADYVLSHYGSGAVMAVPAHDQRDFDFAQKHGLEVIWTIKPKQGEIDKSKAFIDEGILFNSGEFDGLDSAEAREKIGESLAQRKLAERKVYYKLRDWIFSRQRYWGEPIPLINCPKCGAVPLKEEDLPLKLPYVEKYQPTGRGESPLADIEEWVNVKCPRCGEKARRETNTMPQWAGSSWYYLRFIDPHNNQEIVDKNKEKVWMPVDLYVGGAEHAVLHLLYARFWHKFLYDLNLVSTKEPFNKLMNVGLVLGEDGQKMSKSRGNVVSPDEIVEKYGADTLRVYEMFMGPFFEAIGWSEDGVKGVHKFLNRVWDFCLKSKDNQESSQELLVEINKLIKKVSENLEKMKFNTSVAFFMEFLNFAEDKTAGREAVEKMLILFSPFAPHFCEELWEKLGNQESILKQKWPEYDENLIKEEIIELAIQINGKVRDKIEIQNGLTEEEIRVIVLKSEKVKKWIEGRQITKFLFIPPALVNIVVK